ncbi:MAG: DnaB-like helicase C-terminal domain-containing protein [Alphaproteobacteria bacterium]|jgi:replicative DNA helicase|nr:DnaB-like helicase C-terminal domain-containing protein [Alphaproteobacteria bacterium]
MNEPVKPRPDAMGEGMTQSHAATAPAAESATPLATKVSTAGDHLPKMQRLYSSPETAPQVIPSAFQFLNNNMGGWRGGLHLLSGEPGSGKTSFALSNAAVAAAAGFPVLYLSFDLQAEFLVLKLLCQQADLNCRDMIDGRLGEDVLKAASEAHAETFSRIKVVEADPELPNEKAEDLAREMIAASEQDKILVIVDYLQIWAAGSREFSEFRHEIAKLTTAMRRLALSLDSPVLAISSQNRQHQGEAVLVSLEGTSDLEYSADTITFLVNVERPSSQGSYTHPDDLITKSRSISVNLRKNRFGDGGSRMVKFLPATGAFDEETVRRPFAS